MSNRFFAIAISALLLVGIGLFIMYKIQSKQLAEQNALIAQQHQDMITSQQQEDDDKKAQEEAEAAKKAEEERIAKLLENVPGIVFWGDGFTSGTGGSGVTYPNAVKTKMEAEGYPMSTVNMGAGGETTYEITARAGGYEILVSSDFVIPADSMPVSVPGFVTADGISLSLLRQGDSGMNEVTINGVEGALTIEQDSYESEYYTYYFTRKTPGDEVAVPAYTPVVNKGSYEYKDYVPVILMGENGGWDNEPQKLIEQQQLILDNCEKNKDNFIILGLTSGSTESRAALDEAMESQWGEHYINLGKILTNKDVLSSYNVELTEDDLFDIESGIIPDVLLADGVHLNDTGYTIVGDVVFAKLKALDYIQK